MNLECDAVILIRDGKEISVKMYVQGNNRSSKGDAAVFGAYGNELHTLHTLHTHFILPLFLLVPLILLLACSNKPHLVFLLVKLSCERSPSVTHAPRG
jgi:hypothetical protein